MAFIKDCPLLLMFQHCVLLDAWPGERGETHSRGGLLPSRAARRRMLASLEQKQAQRTLMSYFLARFFYEKIQGEKYVLLCV